MRRRLLYLSKLIFPFLLILSFFFLVWFFINSSIFKIQNVTIIGNKEIFSDLSVFDQSKNIFFFNSEKLTKELQNNPYILSAVITKQLPNTLLIKILERKPVAIWNNQANLFIVDENGMVFPQLAHFQSSKLPEILCPMRTPGTYADHNLAKYGLVLTSKVMSELSVQSVSCLDELTLGITIQNTEVIVNTEEDLSKLEASLLFLFKQFRIEGKQPKKVDMRFEKPVLLPEGAIEYISTESAQ